MNRDHPITLVPRDHKPRRVSLSECFDLALTHDVRILDSGLVIARRAFDCYLEPLTIDTHFSFVVGSLVSGKDAKDAIERARQNVKDAYVEQ